MWQRFSENARRIVFYAQEAAKQLGTTKVSTEHLLLGLLQDVEQPGVWPPPPIEQVESGDAAAFVLREIGADISTIRAAVEQQRHTSNDDLSHDMELTSAGKRVIDIAYNEARHLNHNYIGPEHLLMGLICVEDGVSQRVLAHLGVEIEPVRAIVAKLPPVVNGQKPKKANLWSRLFGNRQKKNTAR